MGSVNNVKKEKPKCLSNEVSIFLREKVNTKGTGNHRTAKVCSHTLLPGNGEMIKMFWRQFGNEVFKTFKRPYL